MPIQSNLSVSPYFDDYDYDADYYRILFKPATAVQVRELNQLQTILQRQIEEFGDVILKRGTLLDGCQASFTTALPFVKLLDETVDGAAANVADYIGLFARGETGNTIALVVDSVNGFVAQDPDLKTLYLRYLDAGSNSNTLTFAKNETLEIYNNDRRLYDIDIVNGSSGFSNADTVVILSAIEVQNTSGGTTFANGTLQVGENIVDPTTNATVEILAVDTTSNTDAITLRVAPLSSELVQANTTSWTFSNNSSVTSSNTNNDAVITRVIGSGATASLLTTQTGIIDSITLEQSGSGYTVLPHVTISTRNGSASTVDTLNLAAENFLARVTVADNADEGIDNETVGVGYAMTVTEGKIYQKGQFLRVAPQSLIVSKYSNTQSDVAVGFQTVESVANASVDSSLNDNAAGYLNENAPGADRLKLVPQLVKRTFAEADNDPDFFPIYKFSEGRPYSQRTAPEYNKIADELARRTYEESGNYTLNPFEITTRSTIDIANSDTTFTYLIDPGLAYINGYRVETSRNFAKNVDKSKVATTVANSSLDLVYGNYVRCNEFVGLHNFSTAQLVELHGTAGDAISVNAGVFSDPNDQIGTARIRSVVYESGVQGTSDAVYRVYLFDIRMSTGRNFKNVRSIYSTDGIADVVLELDPSSATNVAVLKETKKNSLIVDTQKPLASLSNIRYKYRTSKEAVVVAANGLITVANNTGAEWPYSGALTTTEKNELIIIPENNLIANSNLSGTITASNTVITGNSTSFASELEVGDYIIADGNTDLIALITSITDNEEATYVPEGVLSSTTNDTFAKVYPKDIPIPLANRSAMTASVSGSNLTLDVDITMDVANTATVVYNQRINGATPVNKPATRTAYVKIQANTHPETVNGPWCLGIPDVFRLRGVYAGTTTSDTEITEEFYIDHNQNENYYDLSYLYQRPSSTYTIGADDVLLVEFDCFERAADGGVMTIGSYTLDDETALASLTSNVNTLEIPELITKDRYHDLREVFDFRPTVLPTANIETTPASADVNPDESDYANSLFSATDIKFPVPEGDIFFDMDYYSARIDTIIVNSDSEFEFAIGRDVRTFAANQFPLYRVIVPPYPSLPKNLSSNVSELLDRKIASGSFTSNRRNRFTIVAEEIKQQSQGYTMEEIGKLERRIEALEYYSNLSQTENAVKDLSLPSSIDATIERFKFGFFVDNFATYDYSDRTDPSFAATIYEYVLQPAGGSYKLPLQVASSSRGLLSGTKVRFPYERKNLLSQSFATTGPREVAPAPEPEPAFTTICQNITNRNENFTQTDSAAQYAAVSNPSSWTGVTEESIFTLTSNTQANGQSITLDFSLYWGTDRIVIQQSTSPSGTFTTVFDTKTNFSQVTGLSTSERRVLRNLQIPTTALSYPEDWLSPDFDDATNTANDPNYTFSLNAGFLKFIGQFSFNYDTSKGRYLKVIVQKASPNFVYRICYPGDSLVDPIYRTIGAVQSSIKPIRYEKPKPVIVDPGTVDPPPPVDGDEGEPTDLVGPYLGVGGFGGGGGGNWGIVGGAPIWGFTGTPEPEIFSVIDIRNTENIA